MVNTLWAGYVEKTAFLQLFLCTLQSLSPFSPPYNFGIALWGLYSAYNMQGRAVFTCDMRILPMRRVTLPCLHPGAERRRPGPTSGSHSGPDPAPPLQLPRPPYCQHRDGHCVLLRLGCAAARRVRRAPSPAPWPRVHHPQGDLRQGLRKGRRRQQRRPRIPHHQHVRQGWSTRAPRALVPRRHPALSPQIPAAFSAYKAFGELGGTWSLSQHGAHARGPSPPSPSPSPLTPSHAGRDPHSLGRPTRPGRGIQCPWRGCERRGPRSAPPRP